MLLTLTIIALLAWIVVILTAFFSAPPSASFVRLMIGIAGVVTIGLILAGTFGIRKTIHLMEMLSTAPAGSGPSTQSTNPAQAEALIYVRNGDTITFDGNKTLLSELDAALKARISTHPHLAISIGCDENASPDVIMAIIHICESIPIKNITFYVSND